MLYEFQVFYCGDGPTAPLLDELVRAETPEQARRLIEAGGKYCVQSVGPGRPLLSAEQRWYNKEEAAVYCRAKQTYDDSPSLIDKMLADGTLERPRNGRPLFSRWTLDKALSRRMGAAMEDAA